MVGAHFRADAGIRAKHTIGVCQRNLGTCAEVDIDQVAIGVICPDGDSAVRIKVSDVERDVGHLGGELPTETVAGPVASHLCVQRAVVVDNFAAAVDARSVDIMCERVCSLRAGAVQPGVCHIDIASVLNK